MIEELAIEAVLAISVLIAPTLPPIEIYQLRAVPAHRLKLKYLTYKTIIIFTNKLHLITYTLNKLYYRIYEAVESILRYLEIVHGILYPIEASETKARTSFS